MRSGAGTRTPSSRWLRRHDPVYWDAAAGVWGITKYDHIKEIESDPATFSNAGGIRPDTGPIPMMIDMDDPEHRKRRKLVAKGFTPNRVREQEPHDPLARPRARSTKCASEASATSCGTSPHGCR